MHVGVLHYFNVAMRQALERTSILLVLFSTRSNWYSLYRFPMFIVCRFFNASHRILIDEKVSAIQLSLNMNVSQHLVPFMVTVIMTMIMLVIMDVLVKAVLTISVEDTTLTLLVVGYKAVLDELSGTMGMKIVRHVIALLLHVVAQLVEGRC